MLIAGLTDWFDGYAARRLGTAAGRHGVVFDPLADKALLVTLFVVSRRAAADSALAGGAR